MANPPSKSIVIANHAMLGSGNSNMTTTSSTTTSSVFENNHASKTNFSVFSNLKNYGSGLVQFNSSHNLSGNSNHNGVQNPPVNIISPI